ncbi:MAG: hypothetical protein FWG02_02380 [Holophagaceae bacterium]|nr:hypothetical protein [Holophagaceae bacterium]
MSTPTLLSAANALYDVFGNRHRVRDDWNRKLSSENARLARAVLGLCLRKWGRLNTWYAPKLKDSARGLPIRTQIALSIGLAQLAWLPGVPVHAAVAESVELLSDPKNGFPPHKGLANAILRSASKDRPALTESIDSLPTKLDCTPYTEKLLRDALQGQYLPKNVEKLWKKLQLPPVHGFVTIRGNPPDSLCPNPHFPKALWLQPERDFPLDWLKSGCGMVQDISSQAVMDFCLPSDYPEPKRILDLCAAPGGKTTSLRQMFPHAQIIAIEQNVRRAEKMKENFKTRRIDVEVIVAEATEWLGGKGDSFDLILLDAPCSASGTFRKHPELNWISEISSIERLTDIQKGLLDAAVGRLSFRGLLIYSVCSWFPEEGINHLPKLLATHPKLAHAHIWRDGNKGETTHIFRPDPLTWDGEGFQGFAVGLLGG